MNNSKPINRTLIYLAVLFQILLIFSFKMSRDISLKGARRIVVKALPVDPRDLFRGDYIILSFDFSRLNLSTIQHHGEYFSFSRGEKVYIVLSSFNGEWKPVEISKKSLEQVPKDDIVLLGSVSGWPSQKHINVVYGIESYFIPEGEGKRIEKLISKGNVTVELAVDKKGNASVCRIFIDGNEVEFR